MHLPEKILTGLNFNTPGFINWLVIKLEQEMEDESSFTQKPEHITTQLVKYNLLRLPAESYIPAERSVNQAIDKCASNKITAVQIHTRARCANSKNAVLKIKYKVICAPARFADTLNGIYQDHQRKQ